MSLGNIAVAAISGDCGHCDTGSRQGPLSSTLTPKRATELSSSVVTTSSMASLTLHQGRDQHPAHAGGESRRG